MQSVWELTGEKLHQRNITVETYNYDEHRIIVEGVLKDDRLKAYHMITGDILPPGDIHHMSIRLLVNCATLAIEDIDVGLMCVPETACMETLGCLDAIKGLTITKGFTSKVKKIAGGKSGCTHLLELLLVMAPATFQGLIAYRAQRPSVFDPARAKYFMGILADTCFAWSQDGPFMKKFRELLDQHKAPRPAHPPANDCRISPP